MKNINIKGIVYGKITQILKWIINKIYLIKLLILIEKIKFNKSIIVQAKLHTFFDKQFKIY